jgi:hypothetical protein
MRTPSVFSSFSVARTASLFCIRTFSVSSITRQPGSISEIASALRTSAQDVGLRELHAETLTPTRTWRPSGSRACQTLTSRQAWASTQRPSGTIWPVFLGDRDELRSAIKPRCGCCQRINASTPRQVTRVKLDDRLVVQQELALVHRLVELALHFAAFARRVLHGRSNTM